MSKRRTGAPADLEEVYPDRFIVHNPAVGPSLRGEGDREGDRFVLTSWRREGFLARVRGKTFVVLTLADQITLLPPLPRVTASGAPVLYTPGQGQRVSYFAGVIGWQPAAEDLDAPGVYRLVEGSVIRRRRGRGPGHYYHIRKGKLVTLDEDQALRYGYAMAARTRAQVVVAHQGQDGQYQIPDLLLPSAHRALLRRLIVGKLGEDYTFGPEALGLVEVLLGTLRLELELDLEG
ncbi:hypothetical protein EYB53_009060 [Candidatus Chloroploca sp. M-50]|uniref:Uncharacterized protein n=1 Tax=Candidatus Chloroploca mongolica TaxID=2528176 RepID=A0ABS4D8U9_9CHLR|nr:hypothetical protein [Candidatus Chloroploca mongolica]MBP1465851.1 hypothetical protein [Candidatus Chloroploca mongolica]